MITPGHMTLESMGQALWYNRWTMNKFTPYVNGDILEVGCGIGNFTPALAKIGKVWAMDIDRHSISKTKSLKLKSVRVGLGDIEKDRYFFDNRKFDSIVCLNVLEHIKNDVRALTNMHGLLKKNGRLILLVPIHPLLFGTIDLAIDHYRRYKPNGIVDELKDAGFHIISTRKLNFVGAFGWWFNGKILKRKRVSRRGIKLFNHLAPLLLPIEDVIEPPFGTSILVIAKK